MNLAMYQVGEWITQRIISTNLKKMKSDYGVCGGVCMCVYLHPKDKENYSEILKCL